MTAQAAPGKSGAPQDEVELGDEQGPAAPPRSNGELVFEAPWESRAFASAIALANSGSYEWETFRLALIDEIGAWERENPTGREGESWSYYERWLAALENLLVDSELLTETEIESRAERVAHEEQHEHDHEHDHPEVQ